MDHDKRLREHVVALLKGGQAYDTFDEVVNEFKKSEHGRIPKGAEHSPWQIVDHMVRALEDILEYSENEDGAYAEKAWPDEYWSKEKEGDWEKSIRAYHSARQKMIKLVEDPRADLFRPFPWEQGHTLLREALLAADHQAYHIGELIQLKRWVTAG